MDDIERAWEWCEAWLDGVGVRFARMEAGRCPECDHRFDPALDLVDWDGETWMWCPGCSTVRERLVRLRPATDDDDEIFTRGEPLIEWRSPDRIEQTEITTGEMLSGGVLTELRAFWTAS